jgi:hypothetical protein
VSRLLLPIAAALLLVPAFPAVAQRDIIARATSQHPVDNWRTIATEDDRGRIRRWRNNWVDAVARARAAGHGAEIDREGVLLDPDAGLAHVAPPPGDYDCRTIKVGARSEGLLEYVSYPAFHCRLSLYGGRLHFTRLNGSQRPIGVIFPDHDRRMILLGTLQLGDEADAIRYSRDTERDMAGLVERIGPRRWRIGFPAPHFESLLDVIELVPHR